MSPSSRLALAAAILLGATAPAQPPPSADDAVEAYLAQHGLDELLGVHLLDRLRSAPVEARPPIAARLARVYVALIERAASADERSHWERLGRDLIALVPDADSYELRLNLAKVRYLQAEEIAERHRLLLASEEDLAEARSVLRAVAPVFRDVGARMTTQIDALERREARGTDEGAPLRAQLAEARRLRSLTMFYAGWSACYGAELTGVSEQAREALRAFGWLLNASGGNEPSLERLPVPMLRFEHVARAAVGVAVAHAARGQFDTAIRWLDAVDSAPEVPSTVREQIPARRLAALAGAKRWADIEFMVSRLRRGEGGAPRPLHPALARLLAVATLGAIDRADIRRVAEPLVRSLAESALTDLVAAGELGHVLDLVRRFGTTPIGTEGFIVHYVRGVQAYDIARDERAVLDEPEDDPTGDPGVANRFREAAESLAIALASPDAERFAVERASAGLLRGLALYLAGDLDLAADQLEQTFQHASLPAQAEESLWLAVVALDRAVEAGRESLRPRLERVAALYLQTYPGGERAARLLLRQTGEGLISDEQAAEVLLAVPPESPLRPAARRHAATLLYRIYRRSRGEERDFAAIRFVTVAQEAIEHDQREAIRGSGESATAAGERAVVRLRQILDALLGMGTPDVERATAALASLDALRSAGVAGLDGIADEIAFRRVQVALARRDEQALERHLAALRARGGPFADAADRLLYRDALSRLSADGDDAGAARALVRHGLMVMGQYVRTPEALADDAVATLHTRVASAAAFLWRAERDADMRSIALTIDRGLVEAGRASAGVLERLAELAEAADEIDEALETWKSLLAGAEPGSDAWYRARFHSLRLMAQVSPARARLVMDQHKALHPDLGPEPWGPLLRDLDLAIPPAGDGGAP